MQDIFFKRGLIYIGTYKLYRYTNSNNVFEIYFMEYLQYFYSAK